MSFLCNSAGECLTLFIAGLLVFPIVSLIERYHRRMDKKWNQEIYHPDLPIIEDEDFLEDKKFFGS